MNRLHYILFTLIIMGGSIVFAQKDKVLVQKGNKAYENQQYTLADSLYRMAMQLNPNNVAAQFNSADALYQQKKYAEAAQKFNQIAANVQDKKTKADAWHNMGNALLEAEKYKESIEAYKKALKLDPTREDTRYNLAYAQKKLKQQQQQQNKDNNKEQNKDKNKDNKDQQNKDQNKDNKDNKDQQNKDNKDKNNQNKDQKDKQDKQDQSKDKGDKEKDKDNKDKDNQNQENKDKKDEQKEKGEQPQPAKLSPKDAQRMLEALNNKEKDLQRKLKKKKGKAVNYKTDKDW